MNPSRSDGHQLCLCLINALLCCVHEGLCPTEHVACLANDVGRTIASLRRLVEQPGRKPIVPLVALDVFDRHPCTLCRRPATRLMLPGSRNGIYQCAERTSEGLLTRDTVSSASLSCASLTKLLLKFSTAHIPAAAVLRTEEFRKETWLAPKVSISVCTPRIVTIALSCPARALARASGSASSRCKSQAFCCACTCSLASLNALQVDTPRAARQSSTIAVSKVDNTKAQGKRRRLFPRSLDLC